MSEPGPAPVAYDLRDLPAPVFFLDPGEESVPAPRRNWLRRAFEFLESAPSPVNWRADGLTGPVRFQGSCQSCTGHAAAAMIEAWARKAGQAVSVSGPYLHTCVAEVDCSQGADPLRLRRKAVGRSAPPYGVSPWPAGQCDIAGGLPIPPLRQVVDRGDAQAILGRSPVVAGMAIAGNFADPATRTYVPAGPVVGHHTVCLVGFDAQGWIAQNSYGPGWGDGGFFRVGYGVAGILQPGFSAIAVA